MPRALSGSRRVVPGQRAAEERGQAICAGLSPWPGVLPFQVKGGSWRGPCGTGTAHLGGGQVGQEPRGHSAGMGAGPQEVQPGVARPVARAAATAEEVTVLMTDLIHPLVHPTETDRTGPRVCAGPEARHPQAKQTDRHLLSCLSVSCGDIIVLNPIKLRLTQEEGGVSRQGRKPGQ